jgi:hypothetical protein
MPTVLPSFKSVRDLWGMCQFELIQLLMHFWGLYQALIANYQELQAQNIRLHQIASAATHRAAEAEHRAAEAEDRAAHAEKRAADRRVMNDNLNEEISTLECRIYEAEHRAAEAEDRAYEAEHRAAEAEDRAYEAEQRADEAENELNTLYKQKDVEDQILHELANDKSWTSVSKGNFINKQTRLVMKMTKTIDDLKSKLQTSTDCCERLVNSVSQLFYCPIDLGVPESNPVLCVGVMNGPAFVSSAETAKNLEGKHPLLHGEAFVTRTLSGLDSTIRILFETQAQIALLTKILQQ